MKIFNKIFCFGGILIASIYATESFSQANEQNNKPVKMTLSKANTNVIPLTNSNQYKMQAQALLTNLKDSDGDVTGHAMKTESYIGSEVESLKNENATLNAEVIKSKEKLQLKAAAVIKNAKKDNVKAKNELIKILEEYIATF